MRNPKEIPKISRPVYSGVCMRKRLFARLDACLKRPVVWISGPAGAGKTILASTFIESRRLRSVWYRVDAGDADLATFFYYMRLAASSARRGKNGLPLFTPEFAHGPRVFSRRFFEEFFSGLKAPFCLVLDNLNEAPSNSAFNNALREALSAVPRGAHVICIGRKGPPGSLSKLMAEGTIEAVGPEELALTVDEVGSAISKRLKGRSRYLSAPEVHRMTGGWAAGLALMLEHARVGVQDTASLGRLARDSIFGYFSSEIFQSMDAVTRRVLMETSLLSEFDSKAAERLTGAPEAGRILEGLCRDNYFTERRLAPRPVYRYHPLFREFLSSELDKALTRVELTSLKARAAGVLEGEGRHEEAALLLRDTGDWEGLARIISRASPELVSQARHQVLMEWIEAVPPQIRGVHPWLLYWRGICTLPADPAEARVPLEAAYRAFLKARDCQGAYTAWSGIVDTYVYECKDFRPLDFWIEEFGRLRRRFRRYPSPEIEARCASSIFGALMFRQPWNKSLPQWRERAEDAVRRPADNPSRMFVGYNLTLYYLWTGRYGSARVVIDALSHAFESGSPTLAQLMWFFAKGLYNFHTSSYDEALKWVERGLEASEASGIHIFKVLFYGLAAMSSAMSGRGPRETDAFLARMGAAMNRVSAYDLIFYHQQAATAAMLRADASSCLEHIRLSHGYARRSGSPFLEGLINCVYTYYLIETGVDSKQVKGRMEGLRECVRLTGSALFEYVRLMLEAIYFLKKGDAEACARVLANALAIGRMNGIRFLLIFLPETSARLLSEALKRGIEKGFATELIRSNGLFPPEQGIEEWPWPIRVRTFGAFEVWRDGEKIEFPRKSRQKPLELLKALLALGGRNVSERALSDLLWPDAEGDAAHGAFSTTLCRLRQLLGGEHALKLKGGRLTLDDRYCWVDAWALTAGLERFGGKRTAGAMGGLRQATKLYRGEFLEDTDAPWAIKAREGYKTAVHKALFTAGADLMEAGLLDEAAECFSFWMRLDESWEGPLKAVETGSAWRGAVPSLERLEKALAAKGAKQPCAIKAIIEAIAPQRPSEPEL